jgi:hypothetical protein
MGNPKNQKFILREQPEKHREYDIDPLFFQNVCYDDSNPTRRSETEEKLAEDSLGVDLRNEPQLNVNHQTNSKGTLISGKHNLVDNIYVLEKEVDIEDNVKYDSINEISKHIGSLNICETGDVPLASSSPHYADTLKKNETNPKIKVINLDPLIISKEMDIVMVRNDEKLGLSISGGLGSTPYKSNDEGVFITKITTGGVAELSGLLENDKILEVNGNSCVTVTHQEIVEHLNSAGSLINLKILREENINKCNANELEKTISSSPEKTPNMFKDLSTPKGSKLHQGVLNYISPLSYMANRPAFLRRTGGEYRRTRLSPNDAS